MPLNTSTAPLDPHLTSTTLDTGDLLTTTPWEPLQGLTSSSSSSSATASVPPASRPGHNEPPVSWGDAMLLNFMDAHRNSFQHWEEFLRTQPAGRRGYGNWNAQADVDQRADEAMDVDGEGDWTSEGEEEEEEAEETAVVDALEGTGWVVLVGDERV